VKDAAKISERRRGARRAWLVTTLALVVLALFISFVVFKPAMPDRIALLTGPEGSVYQELGQRYAAELEKRGLYADVIVTDGAIDNLIRLAAGADDAVALAPSGIEHAEGADLDTSELVALGNIGLEPLWLFYRSGLDIESVADLASRAVVTGGSGSVSDYVARLIIEKNGIAGSVEIRSAEDQHGDSPLEWIESGQIDALFVTGSSRSTLISTLLDSDDIAFHSFDRAAAYAARINGIMTMTVPEGVFDLARNNPPRDARILSASTQLVTLDGLHPAVVSVVLGAAVKVHDGDSPFSSAPTFPTEDNTSLPLDSAAKRYFDQGERGLSKFLPYKVTRHLNHLGFVVLPLLTLVVVLLKLLPTALRIYGNAMLTGLLKRLEVVEKGHAAGADRKELLADLDRIDAKSAKMFVPRSTVHDYIDFRQFLHDMRERVRRGTE